MISARLRTTGSLRNTSSGRREKTGSLVILSREGGWRVEGVVGGGQSWWTERSDAGSIHCLHLQRQGPGPGRERRTAAGVEVQNSGTLHPQSCGSNPTPSAEQSSRSPWSRGGCESGRRAARSGGTNGSADMRRPQRNKLAWMGEEGRLAEVKTTTTDRGPGERARIQQGQGGAEAARHS